MRKFAVALPLLLLSGWAAAQDCAGLAAPTAPGARPAMAAAVAPELASPHHQLGATGGVLAQAYDEAQSVDNVLLRMRVEKCQSVAAGAKAPTAPAASSTDPAAYKPLTKHDNSPWRFDMSQNGKRMTAEEFDAWMKSRGVRVAKGAPVKAAEPVVEENEAK